MLRINVSPDDSHMAFVTASRLSSYDNADHLEMYSYTPASGALVCDSCNPDGRPATADVQASQDGLFMTNDGRTFFSTTESLVPQDTNEGPDVYEYVGGRPQLITPGTGTASAGSAVYSFAASNELPGLVGVSADGADVYFGTFDPLVSGDQNGNFFSFYDARTNGGFAQPPPVAPCDAAEECHGPGNEAPALPTQGTAATLAGGNAAPDSHKPTRSTRAPSTGATTGELRPPQPEGRSMKRTYRLLRRAPHSALRPLMRRLVRSCCGLLVVVMGASPCRPGRHPDLLASTALPSTSQAGGHPDVAFSFAVGNRAQIPSPCACNDPKNIFVHLPTGLIGNPHATPQCALSAFAANECPADSQIGFAENQISTDSPTEGCSNPENASSASSPRCTLSSRRPKTPAFSASKRSFSAPRVFTVLSSRTDSDYGVDSTIENIPHFFPLFSAKEDLWGVPADPVHDFLRFGFRQLSVH